MSKHKSAAKEKEKSGQLVIRVAKPERASFIEVCEALDTTAAREIRRFMREFVAANAPQTAREPSNAVSNPAPEAAEPAPEVAESPKKAQKRAKS